LETAYIPLATPDLRGNEAAYLRQCVDDNWVSSAGPFVIDLEKRMAELSQRKHGVAVASGTAALHLALLCAGVRPGDGVILPDWTFAATANAIHHAGAVPYFVDVDPTTWTLSPQRATEAIEIGRKNGLNISALIAVHVLGHPADMDPLVALGRDASVTVIEDAAGAIGATYKGRPAGAFGDAGTFSFNGNKTVTAGGGGMIVTDREDIADRARHLSTQARPGNDYWHDEVGFNYRMTNLNSGVGLAQLERLDEMVAAKRGIADAYDQSINERDDLMAMPRAPWAESSCWLYSVLTASHEAANDLVNHLEDAGIGGRVFWRSLSPQPAYANAPHHLDGSAARLSGRVVSLPCSSWLTEEQISRIIGALATWRGAKISREN
jgi:perosamine synthetase